MNNQLETRRIWIFLVISFGLAWFIALVIYFTGGLIDSPPIIPGTPITLALILIAGGYMFSPAAAHVITRLITREGWANTNLRPQLKVGWRYWLAGWFLPVVLTILGAVLFFALFPRYFDSSLNLVSAQLEQLEAAGTNLPAFTPWLLVAVNTLSGVLIAPIINSLFTFGEEFGWRAYLQPKLMPLGGRRAMLLMGVIWGIWHWPVIAMGHNFGLNYPGAPWLGMLAMTWFTIVAGTFLGWISLRGGSVWPAVIGHAAINGIASIGIIFIQGDPNPLLGPLPVSLIGSIPWAILALWIFLTPEALIVSRET